MDINERLDKLQEEMAELKTASLCNYDDPAARYDISFHDINYIRVFLRPPVNQGQINFLREVLSHLEKTVDPDAEYIPTPKIIDKTT